MLALDVAAAELIAQLDGLGLKATTDPRDLDLPGVLLEMGTLTFDVLDPTRYTAQWSVWLIARNNGVPQAIADLSELLDKIREPLQIATAQPVTLQLPNHGADGMPSLLVEIETQITEET